MIDLIVRETNRYARQKLATNIARLNKWQDTTRQEVKAYLGICLIMGINNLPRLAMYWSSDQFIGNMGIQNLTLQNIDSRNLTSNYIFRIRQQSRSVAKIIMIVFNKVRPVL